MALDTDRIHRHLELGRNENPAQILAGTVVALRPQLL